MLTKTEIEMVQGDWKKVLPIADAAAGLFYGRLFDLDPSLRPLFKDDLTEQKKKLLQTLNAAVTGLDNLPSLVPVLQALGKRHTDYGVVAAHYATVGSALIWTLKKGLGAGFTAVHEAAWAKVYDLVSKTMIAGAAIA
jgi:hemoglobin-like flavoprotein